MTEKEFYEMVKDKRTKASAFAREVVKGAKAHEISIPEVVRCLCEEYAANECAIAEHSAYEGGYSRGLGDGRKAERQGW
jgi:hypothetical protein